MPQLTVEERLKSIGLDPARDLEDLAVDGGETLDLDPRNDRFKEHITMLPLDSIRHIKQVMGVPDDAVEKADPVVREPIFDNPLPDAGVRLSRRIPPLVLAEDAFRDASTVRRLYDISAKYVFGDSRNIDDRQIEAVDKWIKAIKIRLPMFLFRDIYVARGATLNVNANALFANHITVENTGRIKFKSGSHSTVFAASFKGL